MWDSLKSIPINECSMKGTSMSIKSMFKIGLTTIVGFVGLVIFFSFWYTIDSGKMVVYQNPATQTVEGNIEPGWYLAAPMVSKTTYYNNVATVTFSGDKVGRDASFSSGPIQVRFPDNYTGSVEATFRFQLPNDPKSLLIMHQDFRSYQSVVNRLLVRTAQDVMIQAATQYTSEDFFQGGLPLYKANLIDFLNNGTPVLEKKRVELKVTGSDENRIGDDGKPIKKKKQWVEIFVPKMSGGNIVRSDAPLKKYGIIVTQVTMGQTTPANDLQVLLVRTKEIFAERRAIRAEQENERQARITATLKGERATEEAEQKAKLEKSVAVVNASKKVALARQEKARILVRRDQELEVATRERLIQAQKVVSAKLEAVAIKAKGLAEAEVDRAKFKARNNPVYLAEIQRDMAIQVSKNMQGINITMPQMVLGGGNGGVPNSVSTINELLSAQLAVQMNGNKPIRQSRGKKVASR